MDASGYLQKHGWRGLGYSLDQRDRGIKKPLLISKKVDALGVGLNKHAAVSEQWWLRAFDQGLKNLGTGNESALAQAQKHGVHHGGLYAHFVKGQPIPASFEEVARPAQVDSDSGSDSKNSQSSSSNDSSSRSSISTTQKAREKPAEVSTPEPESGSDPSAESTMAAGKRKRAVKSTSEAKRARRKINPSEDVVKSSEQEAVEKRRRAIDLRVTELLRASHRRGLIPAGPNELRKGIVPPEGGAATMPPAPSDYRKILEQPSVKDNLDAAFKGAKSPKAQKLARERMKREFKRAARTYLVQQDELTHGNCIFEITAKFKNSGRKRQTGTSEKPEVQKRSSIETATGGVSSADVQANVADAAISLPTITASCSKSQSIPDKKLQEYIRRAAEKGVSLEHYINRRGEKREAKRAKTLKNGIEASTQHTTGASSLPPATSTSNIETLGFVVDTIGDSKLVPAGSLSNGSLEKSKIITTSQDAAERESPRGGSEFAQRVLAAIAGGYEISLADPSGDEVFKWSPGMSVPKDPRLWEAVVIKTLPKSVRKARQGWLQDRRNERKAQSSSTGKRPNKPLKSRGERKVEAREEFLRELLVASRKGPAGDSTEPAVATIQGVANVPLVKVETSEGQQFSKAEMGLARTVARRVLRAEKREQRAREGKKPKTGRKSRWQKKSR